RVAAARPSADARRPTVRRLARGRVALDAALRRALGGRLAAGDGARGSARRLDGALADSGRAFPRERLRLHGGPHGADDAFHVVLVACRGAAVARSRGSRARVTQGGGITRGGSRRGRTRGERDGGGEDAQQRETHADRLLPRAVAGGVPALLAGAARAARSPARRDAPHPALRAAPLG